MTALPKHRPSTRRQGRRRASIISTKLSQKSVTCRHCGQPKMAGFVCSNCHQA